MMLEDFSRLLGAPPGPNEALYERIVRDRETLPWPALWAEVAASSQVAGFTCTKVMFRYVPHITAYIGGAPVVRPGRFLTFEPALFDNFAAFFRDAIWVHITRRDTVAQAVSMYFAETTGRWATYSDTEIAPAIPPRYDGLRLQSLLDDFGLERQQWQHFFAHYGIEPVGLVYEDAVAAHPAYLAPLLARAGLAMPAQCPPRRIRKIGGALQANTARLLREDIGLGTEVDAEP
jgi:hypothetical protein